MTARDKTTTNQVTTCDKRETEVIRHHRSKLKPIWIYNQLPHHSQAERARHDTEADLTEYEPSSSHRSNTQSTTMSDKPPSPTTTVETQMTTQDQLLERREQGGPLTAR